jgi:hypothetical protein
MEEEFQPVDDQEYVYRRIPQRFCNPDLPVPIPALAFRPNQNDTTGISVFRARFVQPAEILAGVDADRRNSYYIARLLVQDLRGLGVTVIPEPVAQGPAGHSVIPELSWKAYQVNKRGLREIQLKLAKLASQAIVLRPS